MPLPKRPVLVGLILGWTTAPGVFAQHAGGGHHGAPHHRPGGVQPPAIASPVSGLGIVAGGYYGGGFGGGGLVSGGLLGYQPGRSGFVLPFSDLAFNFEQGWVPAGQEGPGGLMLPHRVESRPGSPGATAAARRTNPARADELMEVGDRSFRGGNYRRAEERYQLAAKANRDSPMPYVHLAQIATVRGDYTLAASHLREAVAATPGAGWLIQAPDIQAMYGEPRDFAAQIARLESYLQAHPADRNAWFVLAAQHYFSGHAREAADALLRLTDRAPDEALTAFVDATTVARRVAPRADEIP